MKSLFLPFCLWQEDSMDPCIMLAALGQHASKAPAACLGEAALLIQEIQDAQRLALYEVQHILIVYKLDVGPVNLLSLVLSLLHLEDVLVEVLLELLIGQIDAELLKVVLLEALKACSMAQRSLGLPEFGCFASNALHR